MDNLAMYIDVTKCTACRSCQVACKSWNRLRAEQTQNRGTHENPPALSARTWNRIRWIEQLKNGEISWSFFSDRCRHCDSPDCKAYVDGYVEGAIIKHASGAVIFTEKIKVIDPDEVLSSCPYEIPKYDAETRMFYKCTLCLDRISYGLPPACVKACPTGALKFGKKTDMLQMANARINQLENEATLYPGEEYSTFWVIPDESILQYIE